MVRIDRKLLFLYRRVQYRVCGRDFNGVMPKGSLCQVEDRTIELTHGDVVHPCVRYIPEGFEGHKWWMVYTPYYAADALLENPILCYSDDEGIPKNWSFYCVIQARHNKGYNSDPTMIFSGGQLYIYWRENQTTNTDILKAFRATFGGVVKNGRVERIPTAQLIEYSGNEDREVCPTMLPYMEGFRAYAMHIRFSSTKKKTGFAIINKVVNKISLFLDLLGLYSEQKSYGLAIWESKTLNSDFTYKRTVEFQGVNRLYRPWHMDFFDYDNRRYAIVQTNQSNADICLAWSDDDENFHFYKRPLMTNKTAGKVGIYKPCAGVTEEGIFYLYYTAQNEDNRLLNKLYLSQISFDKLVACIQ